MSETQGEMHYEILALKYAEHKERKRFEAFIAADDHDAPFPLDYFVWVVRNAQRTIVIDTGFDAAEAAKRGRRVQRAPAEALAMLGVDAATITDVVITHLHYDRSGGRTWSCASSPRCTAGSRRSRLRRRAA